MSLQETLPRRRGARPPLALRARGRLPRPSVPVLAALVLAGLAAGGGWLWARDSSLAEVRDVQVTGSTSSEQGAVRAALAAAALDMTTLHVREDALRAAVAPFASVADLHVQTDFPHRIVIEVVEHRPVAALEFDGRRVPAAGSGALLRGVRARDGLPTVGVGTIPATERVSNRNTLTALAIAAAAPELLRRRAERIWTGSRGMMLSLRDGPDLIFGTSAGASAKWGAAARVLAEPSAAGATYLDLRIPGRVAAGGLEPVTGEDPDGDVQVNPQP